MAVVVVGVWNSCLQNPPDELRYPVTCSRCLPLQNHFAFVSWKHKSINLRESAFCHLISESNRLSWITNPRLGNGSKYTLWIIGYYSQIKYEKDFRANNLKLLTNERIIMPHRTLSYRCLCCYALFYLVWSYFDIISFYLAWRYVQSIHIGSLFQQKIILWQVMIWTKIVQLTWLRTGRRTVWHQGKCCRTTCVLKSGVPRLYLNTLRLSEDKETNQLIDQLVKQLLSKMLWRYRLVPQVVFLKFIHKHIRWKMLRPRFNSEIAPPPNY